jgi:hypothetical protein
MAATADAVFGDSARAHVSTTLIHGEKHEKSGSTADERRLMAREPHDGGGRHRGVAWQCPT